MKEKKYFVIGGIVLLLLVIFFVTRVIYSAYLDNKVNNTKSIISDETNEAEIINPIIEIQSLDIDGSTYTLAAVLDKGAVSSGDVVIAHVIREDGTNEKMNAYIVAAPDGVTDFSFLETENFVKLILPQDCLSDNVNN